MTPIVRKRPQAFSDLIEIAAYIAFDNQSVAERFLGAADDAFAKLAAFPDMGARCPIPHPSLEDVRFWPIKRFRNYIIYYRRCQDGIEILRVLHAARDAASIFAENPPGQA
jgi:toxin ParE1/3/4